MWIKMTNAKHYYQFGNPLKIKFRNHNCFLCNHPLTIIKHKKVVDSKSEEARYYDFTIGELSFTGKCEFIHKIFYCSKCKKELEFVTQLSFEDHNEFLKKMLKKLKHYQVIQEWIDVNGNSFEKIPNFDDVSCYRFSIIYKNKKTLLFENEVKRKKIWERPLYISYDKRNIKKIIKQFKNQVN